MAEPSHAVDAVLSLPISASVNLRLVRREPGAATLCCDVTEAASVGSGHLNGGELYALMDYAAYLALLGGLPEETAAVTHDFHCAIASAAPRGEVVRFEARVEKSGGRVAFMRVDAILEGSGKLVAFATVTKSILALDVRMRHANSGVSA